MEYLLALDAGTTSLKATLFDRAGRQTAGQGVEYALLKSGADIVELDCETYWRAARQAVRAVLAQSGVDAEAIVAVGVTSQGETLAVLDRQGQPLRPAIVWLDNRSRAEADEIARTFPVDEVYRRTGQPEVTPTWTATRILWLRRHEPQTYERAHKYLLVADYLLFRLTGRFVTDRALNPSTLYYDLTTGEWWPAMLEFLGLRAAQLPELATSGEVVGTISDQAAKDLGLRAGTPVTSAPIDQVAAAVGAGNLEPGVVTESTGAALALCATLDRPLYDPQHRVGLYVHALPRQYVLLPWTPTAGMMLRWFRDEFGGGRDYGALAAEAADVPPGADGLVVLPHLAGAGCPKVNPRARGVFWGATLGHHRGHFVRAIMEAVAFMLRGNLELLASLGAGTREVRCLGGGARSDLWLQIKADVCRTDLLVMDAEEAAGLGTAMIAAVGAGLYGSLAEAREQMVRVRRRVTFDAARADRYDGVYRRYKTLDDKAQDMFE
jgi:xylulokinase